MLATLTLVLPARAFCQSDQGAVESYLNRFVLVETDSARTFQGELVKVDNDRIEIADADGIINQILRDRIKSFHEIEPQTGDGPELNDVSSHRLIMAPTAFEMGEGRLVITDIDVVGVTAAYGITRNFSVWGGATLSGTAVNARFSFELAHGGLGISIGSFLGFNWFGSLTDVIVPYLSSSIGSESRNLTIGLGGVFTLSTNLPFYVDLSAFVVALGGKLPLSPTVSFVTESWLILPYDTFLNSFGESATFGPAFVLRFAGSRISWDIGLAVLLTVDPMGIGGPFGLSSGLFPLPILSVTYRIN